MNNILPSAENEKQVQHLPEGLNQKHNKKKGKVKNNDKNDYQNRNKNKL